MSPRNRYLGLALALAVSALACSERGSHVEISARRSAERPSNPVVPGATVRERYEVRREGSSMGASDGMPDFEYDLPEGWERLATTKDRYVNLRPGGDPEASCYLSILPGPAGGLEANVNRWRAQLGNEALDTQTIAALPTHELLARESTLVEVEGSFTGMGGGAPRDGYALLGLVRSEPRGSLFLKFTGPAARVKAERQAFLDFATSLRLGAVEHSANDGHDHGAPEQLVWKAPPGWLEGPPRSRREVTFVLGDGAECYVTRLLGDGGGLQANLERWSRQINAGPLKHAAVQALPQVEMLGTSVALLELEGAYSGMKDEARQGQALMGVAWIGAVESYFVKMTGPSDVVRAERENFLLFLAGMELSR